MPKGKSDQIGDKGALNEMEMVRSWWKGEEAPKTQSVQVDFKNGKVRLSCPTSSTWIGYRKSTSDPWEIFTQAFEASSGDSLYLNAQRIGYLPYEQSLILN
ncbi:hypothetical protein [Algoriphagus mannitolivorans]|uniref:hypothetical protein n=1 Tax=Algoriphagus mannitolivorans TaxID=226504 RepID=UPI0004222F42|nr:hypothetical protein [Algoriphagus mannitolivorans]